MFKYFWPAARRVQRGSGARWFGFALFPVAQLVIWLPVTTGCRTGLPPTDLKAPGWTLRQGQAVWSRERGAGEIAGDLLVATRADGSAFVQFTKTPFPFVVARSSAGRWEVEFPTQDKRYSGRGTPPRKLIWLYLPRMLSGAAAPSGWTWHLSANEWHLQNLKSGETLEGYFTR